MKHNLKVTLILVIIFLLAQLFGVYTYTLNISPEEQEDGTIVISHKDTVLGPTPELEEEEKSFSFIPIFIAILIGTVILFALIRFNLGFLWKYWFLLAVVITMTLSFEVYFGGIIAFVIALILGILKVFRHNVLIHNLSEIFIYTGIVIVIAPLLNLFSAMLLLVAISIYDIIAVWKSKHMVKLAKFQTKTKLFAGLFIPYKKGEITEIKTQEGEGERNAILGGGDIAFPLLFSVIVIEWLIKAGREKFLAANLTLIVVATTTIALTLLLLKGKKNKFYPAMPFITFGSFAGFAIVYLLFIAL